MQASFLAKALFSCSSFALYYMTATVKQLCQSEPQAQHLASCPLAEANKLWKCA